MVFIIKATEDFIDYETICKYMINMELNKTLFDQNGKFINHQDIPFNKYYDNNIEYEFNYSSGTIIIHHKNFIYNSDVDNISKLQFIKNLKLELKENIIKKIDDICKKHKINLYKRTSVSSKLANSTNYTEIYKYENYKRNVFIYPELKVGNSSFVWQIISMDKSSNGLKIHDFSNGVTEKELKSSPSCIIYDAINLYDFNTFSSESKSCKIIKQLDYPSIKNYTVFTNNKIINESIYLGNYYKIDYEICKEYVKLYFMHKLIDEIKESQIEDILVRQKGSINDLHYEEKNMFKLPDINKGSAISCYITNCPLYDEVYILEIISSKTGLKSKILVNRFIANVRITYNKKECYIKALLNKNGLSINNIQIIKIKKTIINVINEMKWSNEKKNLYKLLAYNKSPTKSYGKYRILNSKNNVYIGTRHLTEYDIIKYENEYKTDYAIFHAK